MTVGLCTVVSLTELKIFVYVLETYELALQQAKELQNGVDLTNMVGSLESIADNGMRTRYFIYPDQMETVYVQESEVGTEVLEVR